MDGSKFICNLKLLVDDPETNDIISWNKNGDAICIYDKVKLTEIFPRYFRSKNFNSFNRQLNLYGFRRIKFKKPNNIIVFKHRNFMKDFPNKLYNVRRQGETLSKSYVCVETQTDANKSHEIVNNCSELRIDMLENEIDNLKAEIHELRASFSTVHVKLANQQNLFSAAFRAMNNPQKQSDVLFNVFIKPNYQSKLKVKSDYTFKDIYQNTDSIDSNSHEMLYQNNKQSPNKGLLKLTSDPSDPKESNTQTVQQTYDVISNNYLNNPNFFNNYPIYVPSICDDELVCMDEDKDNRNESEHSFDSTTYVMDMLNNLNETHSVNDLD